jgi:hypothetical protein
MKKFKITLPGSYTEIVYADKSKYISETGQTMLYNEPNTFVAIVPKEVFVSETQDKSTEELILSNAISVIERYSPGDLYILENPKLAIKYVKEHSIKGLEQVIKKFKSL